MRAGLFLSLCLGLLVACSKKNRAEIFPNPTREEVWAAIQPAAARYRLDPSFIYAVVAADSNFDAHAQHADARGLLQIKPVAWRAVSSLPYETNGWNWRTNLDVGIDYLAYARSYLHGKTTFSYPLLLASFHYGLAEVERQGFDVSRFAIPDNEIYRELWRGNLQPVDRSENSVR